MQRCVTTASLTHCSSNFSGNVFTRPREQSGQRKQTEMTFCVSCERMFSGLIVRRLLLGVINVTGAIRLHYEGRYVLRLRFPAEPREASSKLIFCLILTLCVSRTEFRKLSLGQIKDSWICMEIEVWSQLKKNMFVLNFLHMYYHLRYEYLQMSNALKLYCRHASVSCSGSDAFITFCCISGFMVFFFFTLFMYRRSALNGF